MNSLLRVCCISNRVRPMDPDYCLGQILLALDEVRENAPDLIVLPAFALCSASCGGMFLNPTLLCGARNALDELCLATAAMPCYVVAGLVLDDWGHPVSVCAVLHKGRILGYVPAEKNALIPFESTYSDQIFPPGTVFGMGSCRFSIFSCAPDQLVLKTAEILESGCDLIVDPCCVPVYAGYVGDIRRAMKLVSKATGCAVALCNGGTGETSSPYLFEAFAGIYECGDEMRFVAHKNADCGTPCDSVTADLDVDIITSQKKSHIYRAPYYHAQVADGKKGILRRISQSPFLSCPNRDAFVGELFGLQVASLMSRMQNTGLQKIVLGVSGGLDSTLALLVAAKATDCLGLPREAIVALTMPGFGTTERTHANAGEFMRLIGCTAQEICIEDACLVHFKDIGQSTEEHNTTFENAQARERTQILFDVSNKIGGLVLGTGDLSESALGWCTFGGDQLAGYNINSCLTKGMVRAVVKYLADCELFPGTGPVLLDVLATPVSPELLPAQNGQTTQNTEEILGSYDLHDFFLYHLIRYHFRPLKLFRYACMAFGAQLSPAEIRKALELFLRRFFASQFKRSCAPDAASITEINLMNMVLPSDGACHGLLDEVRQITLPTQGRE